MTDTAIQIQAPARAYETVSATPADLLRYAMEQKADVGYLRELMGLQKEWEADQARKLYVEAMAAFKADPPIIIKDKRVSYPNKGGGKNTEYDHATLGNVAKVIATALGKHGLSHQWNIRQGDAGQVEVSCILTHARGHKESVTLRGMEDTSGGKNAIQSLGSTVTYLQRYTLLAITGLAAEEGDNDGRPPATAEPEHVEDPVREKIVTALYAVADDGIKALSKAWAELADEQRAMVGPGTFEDIKLKARSK